MTTPLFSESGSIFRMVALSPTIHPVFSDGKEILYRFTLRLFGGASNFHEFPLSFVDIILPSFPTAHPFVAVGNAISFKNVFEIILKPPPFLGTPQLPIISIAFVRSRRLEINDCSFQSLSRSTRPCCFKTWV